MREAKKILREMLIGLGVWILPVLVILVIISTHKIAMACGVLFGGLAAAGLLFHMYKHLDIALDMDEKNAQRHIQFASMKRMFLMAVVLGISLFAYRYVHPVGTVFGIFGLKICAFLQPAVHNMILRKQNDK